MHALQTAPAPTPVSDSSAHSLVLPPLVSQVYSPDAATIALPPVQARGLSGETQPPILVADDDEDDVFFIHRLIKKTGVKNPVKVFDDGSEVVNFLGGARL